MEQFTVFFERKERNPLRKKELAPLGYDNKAYADERVKEFEADLPPDVNDTYQILKRRDPSKAEDFISKKKHEIASSHLRTKITPEYTKIMDKFGVQVFTDGTVDIDINPKSYQYAALERNIRNLVINYKDILPNRKPRIVVTNTSKNKASHGAAKTGEGGISPGFYKDRIIYMDQYKLQDFDLLVHEYAHFVADRIPRQTEEILKQEYVKMLDSYFEGETGKPTRRKALEGQRNNKLREMVAKKLGLPSVYSTVNFDEWFAELITYWKTMKNNVHTYRLKSAIKRVLTRL